MPKIATSIFLMFSFVFNCSFPVCQDIPMDCKYGLMSEDNAEIFNWLHYCFGSQVYEFRRTNLPVYIPRFIYDFFLQCKHPSAISPIQMPYQNMWQILITENALHPNQSKFDMHLTSKNFLEPFLRLGFISTFAVVIGYIINWRWQQYSKVNDRGMGRANSWSFTSIMILLVIFGFLCCGTVCVTQGKNLNLCTF